MCIRDRAKCLYFARRFRIPSILDFTILPQISSPVSYTHLDVYKRQAELYLNRFALINIDEFDQITLPQQGFLKHILQKPVVNLRKPHGRSVLELQRYASFIGTSNQKDLLTDPSGSRRVICIEVTGNIDTTQPIDYEQLYAQAMHEIHHGERYWFDSEDEQIMTENNRCLLYTSRCV